jgi:hypothetical protein
MTFRACQGKARRERSVPSLHQLSTVRPSFDHGGRLTRASDVGPPGFDSTWGGHEDDDGHARVVAAVPEPATPSPGYTRFPAADGCAGRGAAHRRLTVFAGRIDRRGGVR